MKIYHWAILGILTLCLGCGSGESGDQAAGTLPSAQGGSATGESAGSDVDTEKAGSKESGKPSEAALPDISGVKPKQILEKMVAAYKNAKSYTDEGQVRLEGEIPTGNDFQPVNLVTPMSMSLEKPNKVLICANKGTAICDGKQLYEYVEPLPDQVLRKPAPETITIESIFTEPILADAMAQGPTQYYTWIPVQAVLLLAENPLNTLLYNVKRTEFLPPEKLDGRPCYRVAIHRPDGKAVFWIDSQSFVLRRFEYPTGGLQSDFRRGQVKDLSVVADFRGAQLNGTIEGRTFQFQPPKKTRIVETLAPLQFHMLGRPAPDFFFKMLDGKPVTLKSLAGKTVVIDFWATWSMQCRSSLGIANRVAKNFVGDDRVVFLACSTDRKTVNDDEIKKMLDSMQILIPGCRDEQDFSHREFHIAGVPTTVVIGPKGIIQDYQTQVGARRSQSFLRTVREVAGGVNVYERQLAVFDTLRTNYEKIIQRMLTEDLFIDPESISQMMPIPGVANQSEPKVLRLEPLWSCKELRVPGNIIVLNDTNPPRFLVCHDARAIAELNVHGQVIKDIRFRIPPVDAAITNIRTGKTAEGKRFYVGFAPSFQQFFFLDEKFKVQWSFPDSLEQGAPNGIADLQVGDLTGDGKPEIYVGYLGDSGVKAVSLEGEVLWANREVTGVTKMAITPKAPKEPSVLLCTTDKTSLLGLNGEGKVAKRVDLGNRRFYWIAAAPFGDSGKAGLCALAAPDIGKNEAFGISLDGDLTWAYRLPDGTPGAIINRVTTGSFFPQRSPGEEQWVLLGADSSIHLVSEAGQPIDSFNYGAFVAGMATAQLGNRGIILVSSRHGVEAITLVPSE